MTQPIGLFSKIIQKPEPVSNMLGFLDEGARDSMGRVCRTFNQAIREDSVLKVKEKVARLDATVKGELAHNISQLVGDELYHRYFQDEAAGFNCNFSFEAFDIFYRNFLFRVVKRGIVAEFNFTEIKILLDYFEQNPKCLIEFYKLPWSIFLKLLEEILPVVEKVVQAGKKDVEPLAVTYRDKKEDCSFEEMLIDLLWKKIEKLLERNLFYKEDPKTKQKIKSLLAPELAKWKEKYKEMILELIQKNAPYIERLKEVFNSQDKIDFFVKFHLHFFSHLSKAFEVYSDYDKKVTKVAINIVSNIFAASNEKETPALESDFSKLLTSNETFLAEFEKEYPE